MYAITNPCHENWDKMTPDEKGKFCAVCQKSVQDLRSKSDEEVIAILQQEKNICVRTTPTQLQRANHQAVIQNLRRAGFIALATLLASCENPTVEQIPSNNVTTTEEIENDIMGDVASSPLQSIPSPMDLIKILDSLDNKKIHYKSAYLKPILPNHSTPLSRDFSLYLLAWRYGTYASSVGYTYFYNDPYKALQYYKATQEIAQLLDLKTKEEEKIAIQKILKRKSNYENMLQLVNTPQSFYGQNHNNQEDKETIRFLIIFSGWLETLYLATLHYEEQPVQALRDEIVSQRYAFEMLTVYPYLEKTPLKNDLEALKTIWKAANIKTIQQPPTIFKDEKGDLCVKDNVKIEVSISQEDLEKLIVAIRNLRNKYQ